MPAAAGETVDQETVDGTEADFSLARPFAKTADAVQEPFQLRAGKIWIAQQSGLFREERFQPPSFQILADRGGTAILPDHGAVHRFAGVAVPQHRRFPLIGDAYRLYIGCGDAGIGKCKSDGFKHTFPDVFGIVFDPAGGRKMLRKFSLPDTDDPHVAIKDHRPCRCRALIDRQNITAHYVTPFQTQ